MKSFLILPAVLLLCACQQKPDARIEQLQKEVSRISGENQNLRKQLEGLQSRRVAPVQTIPVKAAQTSEIGQELSVDEMKIAVKPLVMDFIKKLQAASETPSKENQFGMHMEYDIPSAVYGLVRTNDPEAPYSARVIVKYEKFVGTTGNSKSYGSGTTTFYFNYENDHWSLQTFE